jgi:isopenicillin N synthase-like dioxygenase
MRMLEPEAFSAAIGESFRSFGFAMVSDHGIDPDLIARGWALSRQFFALPDAVKRSFIVPGGAGQRGYTPFGTEIAKGAALSDLKEFWHVGRTFPTGSPLAGSMPENVWPACLPGFRETMESLYSAFDKTGARILSAIAVDLGLAADWFDEAIATGNSILRLLHYPPVPAGAEGLRAGAHEDINLITLLLGAEEAGLELQARDGSWLPVDPPPGALVVNVGDMLQRLTNHVLPSTPHRVINPNPERAGQSRWSMPFFLHLRPDFVIDPLPQCASAANPARYPPITAQAYLNERLAEIGLLTA